MKNLDFLVRRYARLPNFLFFSFLISFLSFFTPELSAQCNDNIVLSIAGPTTGTWTAPASGGPFRVQITATGASGGAYLELNPDRFGGTGASLTGEFIVQNGETIRAISGEGGYHSQLEGGGGGGGSGAINCGTSGNCATGTLLILAAGGSGGQLVIGAGGSAALGGSGNGGNTYSDNDSGGGGGGLNGPGQTAGSGGAGGSMVSFTSVSPGGLGSRNIAGGSTINDGGAGMGGGGGGGDGATIDNGSGGGGGHTGGDGGNANPASSFNIGMNQINIDGVDGGGSSSSGGGNPSDPGTVTILCMIDMPLSVELINFKAISDGGEVSLLWNTATEVNNEGFEIEHSLDGQKWNYIGFVEGAGNTLEKHDYDFLHKEAKSGINYYRLKQLDFDGVFEYTPMVVVEHKAQNVDFELFPNPSNNGLVKLRVHNTIQGIMKVNVYDWTGRVQQNSKFSLEQGARLIDLSLASAPKGLYTVSVELSDGQIMHQKLLLR